MLILLDRGGFGNPFLGTGTGLGCIIRGGLGGVCTFSGLWGALWNSISWGCDLFEGSPVGGGGAGTVGSGRTYW